MRRLAIALTLLAVGCGGSIEKDPNVGSNNGGGNNGGTNNGDANNGANNNGDSNNPVSSNNVRVNNGVDPQNNVPANNGAACETRADCSVDQECIDGACASHRNCYGNEGSSGFDGTCEYVWSCEDYDGKIYAINCEDDGSGSVSVCSCVVNDVVVDEFSADAETTCNIDTTHRAANEGCGFLLPSF